MGMGKHISAVPHACFQPRTGNILDLPMTRLSLKTNGNASLVCFTPLYTSGKKEEELREHKYFRIQFHDMF